MLRTTVAEVHASFGWWAPVAMLLALFSSAFVLRQTPPFQWVFIVGVAALGTLALVWLDGLLVGNLEIALLAFFFVAMGFGFYARARLKDGLEEEFLTNSVSLRRKTYLLLYESFLLLSIVVCIAGGVSMLTLLGISWTGINPFDDLPGRREIFFFFLDQAVKGAFYDIMKLYDLTISPSLTFEARGHPVFTGFLVVFRWASSFILVAGTSLLLYRLFLKRRPGTAAS